MQVGWWVKTYRHVGSWRKTHQYAQFHYLDMVIIGENMVAFFWCCLNHPYLYRVISHRVSTPLELSVCRNWHICRQVPTYVRTTLRELGKVKYLFPNPFFELPTMSVHKARIWEAVEYFARAKHISIPRGWDPWQHSWCWSIACLAYIAYPTWYVFFFDVTISGK